MSSLLVAQPLGKVTEVQESLEAPPLPAGQPDTDAAPGPPSWACLPPELLAAILHPARVGKEVRAACKAFRSAYDAGVQRATLHLLAPAVLSGELLPAPPPAPVVRLDAADMMLGGKCRRQAVVTAESLAAALGRWPVSVPLQLDLSGNRVAWGVEGRLLADMLRCPTFAPGGLQVLDLSGNSLGPEDAQLLADAVASAPQLSSLRELALRNCYLMPKGAASLCSALQAATHVRGLRLLDLGSNSLGPQGAAALAACMCGAPHLAASLRQLDVARNNIQAQGAAALADAVAACGLQLTHLNIGVNGFSSDGAVAWGAALRASTHLSGLQVLDLSGNGVGSQGMAALCESLLAATHLARLQRLALIRADCGPGGTERFAQLLLAAPHLAGIQELDLSGADMSSREAAAVARAVLAAGSPLTQLRSLQLGCNCMEGLQNICSALPGSSHLSGLRQLSISSQKMNYLREGAEAQAACAALRASPHLSELQQLSLAQGREAAHSTNSLLGLLRTAPHLRSLTAIHINSRSPGGLAGLHDVLDLLPRLRSLKVEPGRRASAIAELGSALQHAVCVPTLEELSLSWEDDRDDSGAQSAGNPIVWTLDVLGGCKGMTGLRRLQLDNGNWWAYKRNDLERLAAVVLAAPHLRELRVGPCAGSAQPLYDMLATSPLAAMRVVLT